MSFFNSYRWCVALKCKNSTLRSPEKLFIYIPRDATRYDWLKLAGRSPYKYSRRSHLYLCEDHFDLEKDMANFYQYTMGLSSRIIMREGVVPTKFSCQEGRSQSLSDANSTHAVDNTERIDQLIEDCQNTLMQEVSYKPKPTKTQEQEETTEQIQVKVEPDDSLELEDNFLHEERPELQPEKRFFDKAVQAVPYVATKGVQGCPIRYRSKMVQVTASITEAVKEETKKIMVHVYEYLCKELEVLKLMTGKEILRALGQVSQRAAQAIGVSETTLAEALGCKPPPKPKQPPRKKRKPATKQTSSQSSVSMADNQNENYLVVWAAKPTSASAGVSMPPARAATENADIDVEYGEIEMLDEEMDWRVPSPPGEACDTHGDSTDEALEEEPEIYIKDEPPNDDVCTSNPLDLEEPPPPVVPVALLTALTPTPPTHRHRHTHTTTETQTYVPDEDIKPAVEKEYILDPNLDHNYHKKT